MIKAIVCIALIGALIFSKLAWAGEAAQFENAAAADNVNGPHLVVAKLLDSSGTGLGLSVAKLLWREVYTAAESQGAPDRSLVDFVDDQSAAGLANGFHDGAAQFAKAHSAAMALWGEVIAGEDQLEVDLCLTLPSGEAVGTLRLAAQDTRHVGLTADVGLNAPIASARINFEPIITTRAALFERIIAADNDSSAHDAPRNGSSVVAEIPKGTLLHAIDVVGDWFRVQLPNGTAAYFPIIDSLVLPQTVRVDRAAIAMRAEPAEGATRLLTQIAPRDYKVDAVRMPKTAGKINFSEIWYEIHAGDLQGWVRASDVYTILGSPAIDFVLGTFLFINGNYDGAARALQAYVNSIGDSDTDPNLGAAYQILGSSQIIGKDLASLPPFAAAPFNRAIARNPYDPAPYALRAVVDLGIDRSPAAAIADLHSALDLDRDEYSARQLVAAMSSIATNGPEALRSRTGLAGATSALEQLARQYLIPVGTLAAAVEPKKIVKVGIDLSLTGPDAAFGTRINNGVLLAFDQANINHDIPGYKIYAVTFDDATVIAGQYDPAQAADNARRLVADKDVVAAVGPLMSGAGKAMTPILSQGGLATITPSSSNPDITDPKFAGQYRPAGKPIYFRTVTTDAYQGPNMANFFAEKLKVKSVYVLDDSGAFGVGVADAFQKQAEAKGIKVVGRDRLDPKAIDYSPILTKIKSMGVEALYYGGDTRVGVELAKRAYDIIPNIIKGGPDSVISSGFLAGAGFPAVEGWYTSAAAPHLVDDKKASQFIATFRSRFGEAPDDYTITAYDASLVLIDSVKRVVAEGKPVTRENVRDAIQTAKVSTIQGTVSFDANGDLRDRTVSIFQIKKDSAQPLTDVSAQYKYLGTAPSS